MLTLLRRELGLLHKEYRHAVILYYVENKSCLEISRLLGISESMVKYLLFKSRKGNKSDSYQSVKSASVGASFRRNGGSLVRVWKNRQNAVQNDGHRK